jgi:hypothetical protein
MTQAMSRTFSPISAAQWEAIKAKFASDGGVTILNDSGGGISHGIQFGWDYDGTALSVTVFHVPWVYMLSESAVLAKFADWIGEAE